MSGADRLIVALDATTATEALRLAKQMRGVARKPDRRTSKARARFGSGS